MVINAEKERPTFRELLIRARETAGVTGAELARRLDMSKAHLHNVEHGKQWPISDEDIYKAAQILNTDPLPLLEAAALERKVVRIGHKPEHIQRLLARMAHGDMTDAVTAKITELLEAA